MKKRKKLIKINNRNFENYEPWVKGMVFGGVFGIILMIIIAIMIIFLNYIFTIDYYLVLIPIISIIIGSILGIFFFRRNK